MPRPYKRILLKLSGEAIMGNQKSGYDNDVLTKICSEIKAVHERNYQLCVVVGGGNICRGSTAISMGIDRSSADYMGMLATVMNAVAIQAKLESVGVITRVQTAIPMMTVAEPYIRRRAVRHMEKGRVVIFAGGTGNPFFTTDTAAALRAVEMNCDVILKGTQVDGIYSADPKIHKDAKKYDRLSYKDVIVNDLNVMDATAITLARDNKIPILIFNIHAIGEMLKVLEGVGNYSIID